VKFKRVDMSMGVVWPSSVSRFCLSVDARAVGEKLQKAIELSALSSQRRHLTTLKVGLGCHFLFFPSAINGFLLN
jgi:hypothetical protein